MLTDGQKRIIIARVYSLWDLTKEKYPQIRDSYSGYPMVRFDVRGKVAGQARRRNGIYTVRFNQTLAAENFDTFLARTVSHEIAHLVDWIVFGGWGHKTGWKIACRALGMTDITRCHTYDTSNVRKNTTTTYCRCRTFQLSPLKVKRLKAGRGYFCRTCKAMLSLEKPLDFAPRNP